MAWCKNIVTFLDFGQNFNPSQPKLLTFLSTIGNVPEKYSKIDI